MDESTAIAQAQREAARDSQVEPLEWHDLAGGGAIFVYRLKHGPSPGVTDRLVSIRYHVYPNEFESLGGSGGSLSSEWVTP